MRCCGARCGEEAGSQLTLFAVGVGGPLLHHTLDPLGKGWAGAESLNEDRAAFEKGVLRRGGQRGEKLRHPALVCSREQGTGH